MAQITETMADKAVRAELGARLERRRLDRDLDQAAVARAAGVGFRTLQRLEAGHNVSLDVLLRVMRALDLLGSLDVAIPPTAPSPVALARAQGRRRRRASGRTGLRAEHDDAVPTAGSAAQAWTWGDDV